MIFAKTGRPRFFVLLAAWSIISIMNNELTLDSFDLIAFDLDDTLAESKQPLDEEMAGLLASLLEQKKVAVVSGASFGQLSEQFLNRLNVPADQLEKLVLLPTSGASLYEHRTDWQPVYENKLSSEDCSRIHQAFALAFTETGLAPETNPTGELIEDRGTQVTFSGLGSAAPVDLKRAWDPDHGKRDRLAAVLKRELPGFSVRIGGLSSIDVNPPGINKAYGLRQLANHLNLALDRIVYVGDALFPGGNDESVLELKIRAVAVKNAGATKVFIRELLTGGAVVELK